MAEDRKAQIAARRKALQERRDRLALEDMVKHVIRSPDMMSLVQQFTEQVMDRMRRLPEGHPDRKDLDEDELNCRGSLDLKFTVKLAKSLRLWIRNAGPMEPTALEKWQPQEGAVEQ